MYEHYTSSFGANSVPSWSHSRPDVRDVRQETTCLRTNAVWHLKKSPLLHQVRGRSKIDRKQVDILVASNIETDRPLNTVPLSRCQVQVQLRVTMPLQTWLPLRDFLGNEHEPPQRH